MSLYEMNNFFSPASAPSPASQNSTDPDPSHSELPKIVVAAVGSVSVLILLVLICWVVVVCKRNKNHSFPAQQESSIKHDDLVNESQPTLFSREELVLATRNFDDSLKLGEGPCAEVYKGTLPNGKEVAVKKLAVRCRQRKEEILNEINIVAQIQHRNLVNLLGCCVEGDRIIVYEYMANKSLEKFLFDPEQRERLDWRKRYNIILGIAKGLLYLHEDSKIRIIHRDIKASNILLDDKFSPKIADFGLAKLLPDDQSCIQTRIAGTPGYMSPEYAMHGQLSPKADVYSFGILLLEIISGSRNSDLSRQESLVKWSWRLFSQGEILEFVDEVLRAKSGNEEMLIRCIHVGLLCIQSDFGSRPTMSDVLTMLSSKFVSLPNPSSPAFCSSDSVEDQLSTSSEPQLTACYSTSEVEPR